MICVFSVHIHRDAEWSRHSPKIMVNAKGNLVELRPCGAVPGVWSEKIPARYGVGSSVGGERAVSVEHHVLLESLAITSPAGQMKTMTRHLAAK